jgi:hypothetical protein
VWAASRQRAAGAQPSAQARCFCGGPLTPPRAFRRFRRSATGTVGRTPANKQRETNVSFQNSVRTAAYSAYFYVSLPLRQAAVRLPCPMCYCGAVSTAGSLLLRNAT